LGGESTDRGGAHDLEGAKFAAGKASNASVKAFANKT
jgi:predicted outer membrane protein